MPRRALSIAVAFATIPFVAPAHAASPDEAYFAPLPPVLTVSRLPRPPAEVPAAVTVIDAETIRATGYRDLARLMRLVPGMLVAKERGSEQWVSYHGPNADFPENLLILIDGRSLSATYLGGFHRNALPIAFDDIERIEVVRGSDAATYGANAYLGVVNIITRPASIAGSAHVSVRGGTSDLHDASASFEAQSGPMGLRLTAEHEADDGMAGLHDGRRIDRLSLRTDLALDTTNEVTLMSGWADSVRQTGYPGTAFNSNPERDIDGAEGYVHLRWRHMPTPDEEFALSAYYSRDRVRNEWRVNGRGAVIPPNPLPVPVAALLTARLNALEIPVDDNYISRRQSVDFTHHRRLSSSLRLALAGEWRRDELEAPFLFFDRERHAEDSTHLSGHLEWRASDTWQWNAGAMVQHFERGITRVSPRLFVNWQAAPGQTLRAGVSRAHRFPDVFNQHSDVRIFGPLRNPPNPDLLQHRWIPNPNLRPARLDTIELGYRGQWQTWQSVLDVRLFQEHVHDQIRRQQVTSRTTQPLLEAQLPTSQWRNLDETIRIEGFETQLDMQPWTGGTLLLRHTLMRIDADDAGTRRSVAPYTASLSWLQRAGPWQTMLSVMRVGPLDAGTGFTPSYRYRVPAYTTLDASIARSFRLAGGSTVEVRLTGENLLGGQQELAHYPLQRTLGDKPLNKLEPQAWLSLSARF